MLRFIGRRLVWALAITWAVASLAFALGRLAGSDVVAQEFGLGARRSLTAQERHLRGLDRPFATQYAHWLRHAVVLDFGISARFDRPVGDLVIARSRNTLVLAATALLIALILGVPAGVLTGSRPHGVGVGLVRAVSLVLVSAPPLITALLLVWAAAASGWLPVGGMYSLDASTGAHHPLADLLWHLPVPALALALPFAAALERVQADALARALREPSIAAARARGVDERRLLWRHAWRLGAAPVAGTLGLMAGALLSGSLAVEIVTAWPGLGALTLAALNARDLYLSAGCATSAAVLLSAGVVLSDLALASIDPRIRDEASGVRAAFA